VQPPETRYALSGSVHIAYQEFGEGPLDLVIVPFTLSHVEMMWEEPMSARFLERLGSFARVVMFDKRGMGLSDRISGTPALEERIDDVRAVMDAVKLERAALFGMSEGGPMSLLFAATYPQRTSALVLFGAFARFMWHPGYPWGATREDIQLYEQLIESYWGTGAGISLYAPSVAGDERIKDWWARFERHAASPGTVLDILRISSQIDVRDVLPAIQVPTLVLHRSNDGVLDVGAGRYLAERIPNAKFVELPGIDHAPWIGDSEAVVDEIEAFLTGARPTARTDRVLATILFTDIVESTRRAVEMGDRRWSDLKDAYIAFVRDELQRFNGREVETAGDGFLATFDGPARAIRCACKIRDGVRRLGIEIRAGVHTGECELTHDGIAGIAVHVGARVASIAQSGEVLVSSTVRDLVAGSGLRFSDGGEHFLKGIEGKWRLFRVDSSEEMASVILLA
jgi:pimeloyl-ACP methyl ester carboxylesterase/class 3 adenylate cyclase